MAQLTELAVKCPKCGHVNLFGGEDIKTIIGYFQQLLEEEKVTESDFTCIECKDSSSWLKTLEASADILETQFS